MITIQQVDTLTSCSKMLLQKLTYLRSALAHVDAKKANPGFGFDLDLAEKDAERQERVALTAADELSDELTKLLKQAAAEQRGVS